MKKVKVAVSIHRNGRITPDTMAGLKGMICPGPAGIKAYIVFIDIGSPNDDIGMQWIHHDAGFIRRTLAADHYILSHYGVRQQ